MESKPNNIIGVTPPPMRAALIGKQDEAILLDEEVRKKMADDLDKLVVTVKKIIEDDIKPRSREIRTNGPVYPLDMYYARDFFTIAQQLVRASEIYRESGNSIEKFQQIMSMIQQQQMNMRASKVTDDIVKAGTEKKIIVATR